MKPSTTQNQTATELDTLYELDRLTILLEIIHNLAHDPHSVKALANEAASICHEAAEELRKPVTQHIRAVGE